MQHHIQTLVKHFFHKESLQEVAVNQLQQFIDDYPYSSVGQLLLAKKLGDTGAQNFDEQGAKASLYFNDPVWAGWVLRRDNGEDSQDPPPALHQEPVNEQPHFVFNNIETTEPGSAPEETPPWEGPAEEDAKAPGIEQVVRQEEKPAPGEAAFSGEPQPGPVSAEAPPPQPGALNHIPESAENDLGFEPYHTVDYFAALGIKLKPEELAKDKLGQQLKSFTDWLRSMKKINPTQATDKMTELDDLTNKSIQKIAEFSNDAKEIITEAMAEVWAKQGHREKAVAIYEKLSLLNPSKSHYFAARIEALKS